MCDRNYNLQFETRTYNLRSWLTGIDCPLFKEELSYQDGAVPQWGGNRITSVGTKAISYDAKGRQVSSAYGKSSNIYIKLTRR